MFELEPNPFEQSFASTKKSHSLSGAVPNAQEQQFRGGTGQIATSSDRGSKVTISEITSNNRDFEVNAQRRSSVFSYGAQKPNLQSPPLLTPGGSRRLPPILLSPNFTQQAPNASSLVGQGQPTSLATGFSNMSPKNSLLGVNGGSVSHLSMEAQRPPLNLSLSKIGFAPNESNMRTGLTPGILTPAHQVSGTHYPGHTLPYLSGPRNDTVIHEDIKNPTGYGMNMVLNSDIGGQTQSYASGMGPLSNHASSQPFFRSNNTLRNAVPSVGPVSLADSSDPRQTGQINYYMADATTSSKNHQTKLVASSSPPRTTARRKRKSSTPSRGSKSSKSSQRNTPTSTELKNLAKKEVSDSNERDSDDGQERKRREFLERNRVAASKFRKRKKEYIKRLEMDLKFYEAEYDDMSLAMNRLCGIVNGTTSPATSDSLIGMLETAVSKNDAPSSLSILAHIKQVLFETRYAQRKGSNPRREIEYPQDSDDDERQRADKELLSGRHDSIPGNASSVNSSRTPGTSLSGPVTASYITSGGPPPPASVSTGSNNSVLTDNTSVPPIVKDEDPAAAVYPIVVDESKKSSDGSTAPSAIGTISTLPTVINGRPVIPLSSIPPNSGSDPSSISEIRHSSLVSLTADVASAEPLSFKYPNSE